MTGRTVRYAESGGAQIAYRVIGHGPVDIVAAFEWASNLDLFAEHPAWVRFLDDLGEFARVIIFDLRGQGLSDPVSSLPPLEVWVDDVRAIMDAVGIEQAALFGQGHAGQLCMLFAAMYPDRTTALITLNSWAKMLRAPDYPMGIPPNGVDSILGFMADNWGTGHVLGSFNPSMVAGGPGGDFVARLERAAASPHRAVEKQRLAFTVDVRDVLPSITAPTLVVQSTDNPYVRPGHGRYLADHITGARLLEVKSADHSIQGGLEVELLIDAVEELLTGQTHTRTTNRQLMTIAFTDIVGSTELASVLGDRRWRDLLEVHESIARREIGSARGTLVKLTGDGMLASFDGPARAVRCVQALGAALEPLGLPIRAGVHTGEVEVLRDDVGGIAVHIAARISALAKANEVLTSSTVRDLVVGSGLVFEDRGLQDLRGIEGPWHLYAAR